MLQNINKKKRNVSLLPRSGTAVNIIYYKAKTTINLILKQTNYLTDGIVLCTFTAVYCYCVVRCDDGRKSDGLNLLYFAPNDLNICNLCNSNLSMFFLRNFFCIFFVTES